MTSPVRPPIQLMNRESVIFFDSMTDPILKTLVSIYNVCTLLYLPFIYVDGWLSFCGVIYVSTFLSTIVPLERIAHLSLYLSFNTFVFYNK